MRAAGDQQPFGSKIISPFVRIANSFDQNLMQSRTHLCQKLMQPRPQLVKIERSQKEEHGPDLLHPPCPHRSGPIF